MAKNTQRSKRNWGEGARSRIRGQRKIPASIMNATTQREIAIRFIGFYATGHVPNTHSAKDIVLAAAHLIFRANAKQSNQLCWNEEYLTEKEDNQGFSVSGQPAIEVTPDDKSHPILDMQLPDLDKLHLNVPGPGTSKGKEERSEKTRKERNIDQLAQASLSLLQKYQRGSLKTFILECETFRVVSDK